MDTARKEPDVNSSYDANFPQLSSNSNSNETKHSVGKAPFTPWSSAPVSGYANAPTSQASSWYDSYYYQQQPVGGIGRGRANASDQLPDDSAQQRYSPVGSDNSNYQGRFSTGSSVLRGRGRGHIQFNLMSTKPKSSPGVSNIFDKQNTLESNMSPFVNESMGATGSEAVSDKPKRRSRWGNESASPPINSKESASIDENQDLNDYMIRVFAAYPLKQDADRIQQILMKKIEEATKCGVFGSLDFSKDPFNLIPNTFESTPPLKICPRRGRGRGLKFGGAASSFLGGMSAIGGSASAISPPSWQRKKGFGRESSSSSTDTKSSNSSFREIPKKLKKSAKSEQTRSAQQRKRNRKVEQQGVMVLSSGKSLSTPNSADNPRNPRSAGRGGGRVRGWRLTPEVLATHHSNLSKRATRFAGSINTDDSFDLQGGEYSIDLASSTPIVGTCLDLEKRYYRLTKAPEVTTVRPVEVLKKSIELVKTKWLQDHNYNYCCEQLKSIRQDLTVQCVRDEFAVSVYELHARLALENKDHAEFNQCQTQLRALHKEGKGEKHRLEFTAYRFLYYLFTNSPLDIIHEMAVLSEQDKKDECVSHALQTTSACNTSDFMRFFKLFRNSPKMSQFLISWFVDRMRKKAWKAIVKAYRPSLAVDDICQMLAFEDEDACLAFLVDSNCVFSADGRSVDMKQSDKK